MCVGVLVMKEKVAYICTTGLWFFLLGKSIILSLCEKFYKFSFHYLFYIQKIISKSIQENCSFGPKSTVTMTKAILL